MLRQIWQRFWTPGPVQIVAAAAVLAISSEEQEEKEFLQKQLQRWSWGPRSHAIEALAWLSQSWSLSLLYDLLSSTSTAVVEEVMGVFCDLSEREPPPSVDWEELCKRLQQLCSHKNKVVQEEAQRALEQIRKRTRHHEAI